MRGYTRSGAFGPIAEFVDLHGGSIERVFSKVDLPLALIESPDLPLLLAEQFRVLNEAGREIGDPFIGASLRCSVNLQHLGAFGAWMCDTPTLAKLIDRCERSIHRYLRVATRIRLSVLESGARLSIEFLDSRDEAWVQNELLGVSCLIDCARQFAGQTWSPRLVRSTCIGAEVADALEEVFGAPVMHEANVTSIEFNPARLSATTA